MNASSTAIHAQTLRPAVARTALALEVVLPGAGGPPGEAAEGAVVREVAEESGIVVRDPVFVASQPWLFPASLMLGFHVRCDGAERRVGDGEPDEVAWCGRDEVDVHPVLRLPPPGLGGALSDRSLGRRGRRVIHCPPAGRAPRLLSVWV